MEIIKAKESRGNLIVCIIIVFFLIFTSLFVRDTSSLSSTIDEVAGDYDAAAHTRDIKMFESLSAPAENPAEAYKWQREEEMRRRIETTAFGE